ncbi:PKD domain-containing protein [Dyadobacter aurulentus]|uniref:PKD domain-containing protein n=1 Tax=Dyadobacter sp. UC 10 TaxID=2605428 RepID=UPI0011F13FDC|nr:PKD domain-containing protein [Dyadobacter sp. UC 10]KAA0989243.1 PKD domain-containing protein [Dyadobacter sp. UC 10]
MICKVVPIFVALITVACSMQEPAAPTARFEMMNASCKAPCQVNFKDMSENKGVYKWQYDWAFKDSTHFSSEQNPVLTFANAGKYRIVLTISNSKYGSSSTENTVTIIAPIVPKAEFTITGNNCQAPCEVSFTNISTNATSYKWEFGDSSAVNNEHSPRHKFNKAGIFKVMLTALNETVSDTATHIVTILAASKPIADFDIVLTDSTRTDSVVYSFVNKSKFASAYVWNFGDNSKPVVLDSPVHAYRRTDKDVPYTVSLTAISGVSTDEKKKTFSVKKK